ncbi:MAG TPA: hypothetical protein VLI04_00440, partial [Nocardioidaceae bacterium]|nr:hypothetical protein [Nocardioidaceae bacterium]
SLMSEAGIAHLFDRVREVREGNCRQFPPENLRDALPNMTFTIPGKTTFRHSTLAVIGQVISADKGPAYAHAGDDVLVRTDFDSPSAAERTVDVHMSVDETYGQEEPLDSVMFRMGLLNSREPALFIDGLAGLGRIVAVLDTRHSRHHGDELIPAEQGALLGRIDADGALSFPGLVNEVEFVAHLSSLDAFRAAAAEPALVVEIDYTEPDEPEDRP